MSELKEHLQWIYDRLKNHHGVNPNVDHMLRFKHIIDEELPRRTDNELTDLEKKWLDKCPTEDEGYEIKHGIFELAAFEYKDYGWWDTALGKWRPIKKDGCYAIIRRKKQPVWKLNTQPNGDIGYECGELWGTVPKEVASLIATRTSEQGV